MEQPPSERIPGVVRGEEDFCTGSRLRTVVIVGAGCFGISTAYHLLKRGFKDVTVIDQSDSLPAPDAASTDLNKSKSFFQSYFLFINAI